MCWLIDFYWHVGAAILKLDRDRKLLNADVTWAYPVYLKSVEPVQKHVNKREQRIIPELNGIILLKLRHEWYTTISIWARRNLTRARCFKMAQILTLKINYNLHQSRECLCDARAFQFLLPLPFGCRCNGGPPLIWIISLYLWYQVYFVVIIV